MPVGNPAFGLLCSIAPWVQTPFASTLLSKTPGRNGDPIGRGMGISPSFTTAGKPKYVTYGKPVASSATAEPSPTLSSESATAGTKRTPLPKLIEVAVGLEAHAAASMARPAKRAKGRFGTSARILPT